MIRPPMPLSRPGPATAMALAVLRALPFGAGPLRRRLLARLRADGLRFVDTTHAGQPVRLHLDNTSEAKFLVSPRSYNRRERRFLTDALPARDGVFVDIGANGGIYALAVACAAGPGTRILCVEPNPAMVCRLTGALVADDPFAGRGVRVAIEAVAVGDRAGTARLDVSTGAGTARLAETGIAVPVRLLADVLADHGLDRIDALKIDIEGGEERALTPFFDTAPAAVWPRAMVIEHLHGTTPALPPYLAARGYRQTGRTRNNLLLRR